MQNVEKVARNGFPVFCNALFINAPLERGDQLVTVLLNHEADQLLANRDRTQGERKRQVSVRCTETLRSSVCVPA